MKNSLDLRYERKYILDIGNEDIFNNFLIENGFKKNFKSRIVNSIYYDTLGLNFFYDNMDGISNRVKYRLRWYNDNNLSLYLEKKKRSNFIGEKKKILLGNFYDEKNLFSFLKNYRFKYENVHKPLIPILKIQYLRNYWLSECNNYRATVDTNIKVECIKNQSTNKFPININFTVLEYKYPIILDKQFRDEKFLKKNIFRLQKNSKYVSGLILLKDAGLL